MRTLGPVAVAEVAGNAVDIVAELQVYRRRLHTEVFASELGFGSIEPVLAAEYRKEQVLVA